MHVERTGDLLIVHAPAKLNLFLEVLGRRADGFHELETVICPVGLCDTLYVEAAAAEDHGELRFTSDWSALERSLGSRSGDVASRLEAPAEWPADHENLACRALELLRRRSGRSPAARAHLVKRIPLAAGLGGGSSDAAAALVAGNLAWNLGLSHEELAGCAAQLGSDVPFFLARQTAVCRGRGERVEPVAVPAGGWFVIVRPAAGLSTAAVFGACRPSAGPRAADSVLAPLRLGDWPGVGRRLYNALEPAAERLTPEIGRLRREFAALDVLGHRMSGSGTSYFGICRNAAHARHVAGRLRARRLGAVFTVRGCR